MPRGRPLGLWKKKDPNIHILPNPQSKLATPASVSIDLHYTKLAIHSRWNYERFLRLAAFLGLTPGELGSLACISHLQVEKFEERNLLMCGASKHYAGALILTMIEAFACKEYSDDVIENPIPNLTSHANTP